MTISIIGAGYVGLVAAACFANRGFKVLISTKNPKKIKMINEGKAPFFEPELDGLLRKAARSGMLQASGTRAEAVLNSDITFVCVGTPSAADGSIDLNFVYEAAEEIGRSLRKKGGYHLVVMRSTVVPGTTDKVREIAEKLSGKKAGKDFGICMCPEFLRQGQAVYDTFNPDRVVIGEHDRKAGNVIEKLFKKFYKGKKVPILRMNTVSAEMVKYVSNSILATKVSFINEIANICERVPNVDVYEVAEGVGLDRRIGPLFLEAGPGFGGSCFPKDMNAIVSFSRELGYQPKILETVLKVNEEQALHVVDLARRSLGGLKGKIIAILGLSFKSDTDDMREAPSIRIIKKLLEEGATVAAYDPVAASNARKIFQNRIDYADSALECLRGADCCMVVTEWDEFKKLKPRNLKRMRGRSIVDARRIWDAETLRRAGFKYSGVGLGK
ncbi:MAG: UDP-glucose 6-dehydrogenase [Candidatus Fermentimicrarchaeum limneticum]|uniref:UDP-glucose 6-dehydrogenase n=1 Tax=Fermentimicrarchaeum limneticum TaxID=2795018 RepID=A0A7D5XIS3_FERL1|nr:MAG: UDP-glucose 6-dehydrogenase [Candidatus Fermentimicrarchaeum limneticum]